MYSLWYGRRRSMKCKNVGTDGCHRADAMFPKLCWQETCGCGACGEYKRRERRGLVHHMRLGKAADDPAAKGHCRASLLGLLAKVQLVDLWRIIC